jgi:hypothetical protein
LNLTEALHGPFFARLCGLAQIIILTMQEHD